MSVLGDHMGGLQAPRVRVGRGPGRAGPGRAGQKKKQGRAGPGRTKKKQGRAGPGRTKKKQGRAGPGRTKRNRAGRAGPGRAGQKETGPGRAGPDKKRNRAGPDKRNRAGPGRVGPGRGRVGQGGAGWGAGRERPAEHPTRARMQPSSSDDATAPPASAPPANTPTNPVRNQLFTERHSFQVLLPHDALCDDGSTPPSIDWGGVSTFPPPPGARMKVIIQEGGARVSLPAKMMTAPSTAVVVSVQGNDPHGDLHLSHRAHVGLVLVARRTTAELDALGDVEMRDGFSPATAALRERKVVDAAPEIDAAGLNYVVNEFSRGGGNKKE